MASGECGMRLPLDWRDTNHPLSFLAIEGRRVAMKSVKGLRASRRDVAIEPKHFPCDYVGGKSLSRQSAPLLAHFFGGLAIFK